MTSHKRWRFTPTMVKDAPETAGVYVLWCERTPLAVGEAAGGSDTVKARLLSHLEHAKAGALGNVTHYSWEINRTPRRRAAEIERDLGLLNIEAPAAGERRAHAAPPLPGEEPEGLHEP